MKRTVWMSVGRAAGAMAAVAVLALAGCSSGPKGSGTFKVAGAATSEQAAAFERIKALAGEWESTDPEHPGTTIFTVSSAGSVVREIMLPGTSHEMTNVYHMDGPDLVVTHYCAIGNQPRMRARPADVSADRIAFGPDSVTNLRSEDEPYMGQLTLVFTGPDTLRQEWRTYKQGKLLEDHAVFEMRRRAKPSSRLDAPAAALLAAVVGQTGEASSQPAASSATEEHVRKEAELMAQMNALTDEHKLLASMCGTFDIKATMIPMPGMEPLVMNAVSTREMILGGKFMKEVQEFKDGPMPATSISFVGFNPDAEGGPRFEITRMSSTITCMMPETGSYDAQTKTFTSSGEHDANGMKGRIRVVHTIVDADHEKVDVYLSMEGYAEPYKGMKIPEYKAMTLEYTRRN